MRFASASPNDTWPAFALSLFALLALASACSGGSGTSDRDGGEGDGGDTGGKDGGDTGAKNDAGDGDGGDECSMECGNGTVCDPARDRCVGDCTDYECGEGQRCEERSFRVECLADCDAVECDDGERCDDSGPRATCVSSCDGACGKGQACTGRGDEAHCEDLSCATLNCQLPEVCEAAADGQGNVCTDTSCASDLDCQDEQFCHPDPTVGGYCVGEVCTPGARRCSDAGSGVDECLPNGSDWFPRHDCGAATCEEGGGAHCPCADDWDCPAHTVCEVGRCEGTGVAPTCFVSVAPMEDVLPAVEFQWGTSHARDEDDSSVKQASGHPFPASAQVVTTPIVVNLDDDNGDGLVNEQDYPEIVFLTMCGSQYQKNGTLRAVHGGGLDADGNSLAGKDYFASAYRCRPGYDTGCTWDDTADQLVWNEGEDGAADSLDAQFDPGSNCADQELDSTSTLAVGNLDGDASGRPEIVALTEDDHVIIYDSTGHFLARSPAAIQEMDSGAPAIANLDGQGLPEIIVGRNAWTLKIESGVLVFDQAFLGATDGSGQNDGPGIGPVGCVADLNGDGRQEIVAGGAALTFPDPAGCSASPCTMPVLWEAAVPSHEGYCAVADVWGADESNPPHPVDNPLDGVPEVLLVRSGKVYVLRASDGAILASPSIAGGGGGPPNVDDFDGDGMPEVGTAGKAGYTMVDFQAPTDDAGGCPAWPATLPQEPVTGDFAMDRGPYAATPGSNPARAVPTQGNGKPIRCQSDADCNPEGGAHSFACNEGTAECVCLHNGWSRITQDGSSQSTGSSVFDFNGDGAAEIVYNDECFFRVYGGLDGRLYSRIPSESRTRSEYPVVADLDNDGNAEIVFGVSNESGQCQKYMPEIPDGDGGTTPATDLYANDYNAGLEVWGEPGDLWVSARRIWNQHSYHITNVSENGAIPLQERPSWDPALRSERGFNSYRSNPPSRGGIAPDLQVMEVKVGASGGGCDALGDVIEITARVRNAGDLRVGADIQVGFWGVWAAEEAALTDASGDPLRVTLGSPLRPGGELVVSATYDASGKAPAGLPNRVRVMVDPDDRERECDDASDDDNTAEAPVTAPDTAADLALTLDDVTGTCPDKTVAFTVHNDGAAPASDVVVRFYAGSPAAGGTPLGMTLIAGPIAPGSTVSETATVSFPYLDITLHATVDPDDAIDECSESNNSARYDESVMCVVIPI